MEPVQIRSSPIPLPRSSSSPRPGSSPHPRFGRTSPKTSGPMRLLQRVLSRDSSLTNLGKEHESMPVPTPVRMPLRSVAVPPALDSPVSFGSEASDDDLPSSHSCRLPSLKRQRVSSRLGSMLSPLARSAFGNASPAPPAFRPPAIHTMASLDGEGSWGDVSAITSLPAPSAIAVPPTPGAARAGIGFRQLGGGGAGPRSSRLCVAAMSLVAPRLYVGDETAAASPSVLREGGVTHVLNCTNKPNAFLEAGGDGKTAYLRLDLLDNMGDLPRMQAVLRVGTDFIRLAHEQGGTVLVHCHRGISRSCTLAMAYLIETTQQTAESVFDSVRAARRIVDPNFGYMVALKDWERSVLRNRPRSSTSGGARSQATPSPRPLSRAG
mmetsp:Transcript_41949/g.110534  ORF Transcript_41949/g.110534 Transcript_41949/m.110534 type:complete len:380 (+) Transcript_41949:52-1191(+)